MAAKKKKTRQAKRPAADDSDRKPFKEYFDRAAANALAAQVGRVTKSFDQKKFVRLAVKGLDELEFNGRVVNFSNALAETLPSSRPRAMAILNKSLPDPLPDCENVTDGYLQWPVGQFIADYGVDCFEESMELMIEMTQRFSAEYAIRPFVERYPEEIFKRLLKLTRHKSPHVRRLCSEGIRTRLPWGRKLTALIDDTSPIWPILEKLRDDDEIYVQKSVANNINDIAKDHPEQVVKRLKTWKKGSTPARDWVIKHALRTLIKDGNADALAIVGYGPPKKLKAQLSASPKSVKIGESVELQVDLISGHGRSQSLLVDYAVHYVRKNGSANAKVFKWKSIEILPDSSQTLKKKHSLKTTTIRALYPGEHVVELQVNGQRLASTKFKLTR